MAHLGLCKRCKSCTEVHPAIIDENGVTVCHTTVSCGIDDGCGQFLTWDSEVPQSCPYYLEHLVTYDVYSELSDDPEHLKGEDNET